MKILNTLGLIVNLRHTLRYGLKLMGAMYFFKDFRTFFSHFLSMRWYQLVIDVTGSFEGIFALKKW